jgi:hypothetical protein
VRIEMRLREDLEKRGLPHLRQADDSGLHDAALAYPGRRQPTGTD